VTFKHAKAIFFLKLGRAGSNFRPGSENLKKTFERLPQPESDSAYKFIRRGYFNVGHHHSGQHLSSWEWDRTTEMWLHWLMCTQSSFIRSRGLAFMIRWTLSASLISTTLVFGINGSLGSCGNVVPEIWSSSEDWKRRWPHLRRHSIRCMVMSL
jgi:hypothetical protein